jgi:hypothetical protein
MAKMDRNELIEARDTLENVADHLYSVDGRENSVMGKAVNILNDLIGCDECGGRGWTIDLEEGKVGSPTVVRIKSCSSCSKVTNEEAQTIAYKELCPLVSKLQAEIQIK